MEHQPDLAPAPKPPTAAPEKAGFFERFRQKREKKQVAPEQAPQPQTPEAAKPEAPRRALGKRILGVLAGEPPEQPEAPQPPAAPEVTAATPHAPEVADTEVYQRAGRVRRFARLVLRTVMAETAAEPQRATAEHLPPLSLEPLSTAADDLKDATDTLDHTMQQARTQQETLPEIDVSSPDYDGRPTRIFSRDVTERIERRIARLENEPEKQTTNVVVASLGIIAVLVAGHQYLARRRLAKANRAIGRDVRQQKEVVASQQETLATQQAALTQLRQERPAQMDRPHRAEYYDKLAEFTHTQAEVTRQTAEQLQHVAERPRYTWRERPVAAPSAETAPERPAEKPLVRVETADTVEHGAAQPGTHAKGFGGSAGAGGRAHPAHTQPGRLPAKTVLEQEAARRARAARLAANAWLYGAGLVVALGASIAALILLG